MARTPLAASAPDQSQIEACDGAGRSTNSPHSSRTTTEPTLTAAAQPNCGTLKPVSQLLECGTGRRTGLKIHKLRAATGKLLQGRSFPGDGKPRQRTFPMEPLQKRYSPVRIQSLGSRAVRSILVAQLCTLNHYRSTSVPKGWGVIRRGVI